jgi:hypothetical protein
MWKKDKTTIYTSKNVSCGNDFTDAVNALNLQKAHIKRKDWKNWITPETKCGMQAEDALDDFDNIIACDWMIRYAEENE